MCSDTGVGHIHVLYNSGQVTCHQETFINWQWHYAGVLVSGVLSVQDIYWIMRYHI
jgi:hypothetical protein